MKEEWVMFFLLRSGREVVTGNRISVRGQLLNAQTLKGILDLPAAAQHSCDLPMAPVSSGDGISSADGNCTNYIPCERTEKRPSTSTANTSDLQYCEALAYQLAHPRFKHMPNTPYVEALRKTLVRGDGLCKGEQRKCLSGQKQELGLDARDHQNMTREREEPKQLEFGDKVECDSYEDERRVDNTAVVMSARKIAACLRSVTPSCAEIASTDITVSNAQVE